MGISMEQCRVLSASLARITREASDVTFCKVEVIGEEDSRKLAQSLNVRTFPTYQYYKVGPARYCSPSPANAV
jgi:hypothetical protein